VTGDYGFKPDLDKGYPNQRAVEWLRRDIPRTSFSNAALFELGSALSFFEIRNNASEFFAAIDGSAPPKAEAPTTARLQADEEPHAAIEAEEAEQLTRDFVLKRLAQRFKGLDLEPLVKQLLECMGYRVRFTPPNEPSVDLIAHRDLLGVEPPIIKVQVKSSDSAVNDKDVSALAGKLQSNDLGLVVALSDFTPPAVQFASQRSNLRLINGEELVDLILEHYDKIDSKYKAALPLRRVYIPESDAESST